MNGGKKARLFALFAALLLGAAGAWLAAAGSRGDEAAQSGAVEVVQDGAVIYRFTQEELQEEREKDDEGEIGKEPESGEQEREGDCQEDGCAVVCKMHSVNSFFLESGRDEKAPL